MKNIIFQIVLLTTLFEAKSITMKNNFAKKISRGHRSPKVAECAPKGLHTAGNPLASMMRSGAALRSGNLLSITSPIASITVPDNQPILDLITAAALQIYSEINAAMQDAQQAMFTKIDTIYLTAVPAIEAVITTGNADILALVNTAFNTATANFTIAYNLINPQELADASANISGPNAAMLTQILDVLNATQENINENIEDGLEASATAVNDALTAANAAIYTQIVAILADPTNTAPIAPQLIYPVPSTISAVLVDTESGIYAFITQAITDALAQIQTIINTQSAISYAAQDATLTAANTALFASLTTEVNTALATISAGITTITNQETTDISALIDGMQSAIEDAVENAISDLEPTVTTIINNITAATIASTVSLIQTNNTAILNLVVQILAPYTP